MKNLMKYKSNQDVKFTKLVLLQAKISKTHSCL